MVNEEKMGEDATRRADMSFRAGLFVHTRHGRFQTCFPSPHVHCAAPFIFSRIQSRYRLCCMRCSPFLKPLKAQCITTFAGRYYTTTTISAGPSNPPAASTQTPKKESYSQDELRRERRTDWKRRQNVSSTFPGLSNVTTHDERSLLLSRRRGH